MSHLKYNVIDCDGCVECFATQEDAEEFARKEVENLYDGEALYVSVDIVEFKKEKTPIKRTVIK